MQKVSKTIICPNKSEQLGCTAGVRDRRHWANLYDVLNLNDKLLHKENNYEKRYRSAYIVYDYIYILSYTSIAIFVIYFVIPSTIVIIWFKL